MPGENNNNILPWTGRYYDGFKNKITMHAYANPDSESNGAGFGFIRFHIEKKKSLSSVGQGGKTFPNPMQNNLQDGR